MLYKHKIIVGSYTGINREIALDLIIENEEDEEKFKRLLKKISLDIKREVKVYEVETMDTSWKSVVEKEEMFDGVLFIEKQEEFLKLLNEPNYLSSLDIANFVLTYRECTHEELERLVYLIYLEYYSEYNKKIFNDNIFIIDNYIVCEDIFNRYKNNKDKPYVFITPEDLLFWAHRQYLGKYNDTTLKEFKKEMEKYNFGFRENGTIKYIEELKPLFEHKIDTTLDGTKKINAIYKVLYKYRKD